MLYRLHGCKFMVSGLGLGFEIIHRNVEAPNARGPQVQRSRPRIVTLKRHTTQLDNARTAHCSCCK